MSRQYAEEYSIERKFDIALHAIW